MENCVVWKIISRTHQGEDFVANDSESEKRNILNYSRNFPLINIKTSAVAVFWVSPCIVLSLPSRDTLNNSQLNSIGDWESYMASSDDLS